MNTTTDSRTVIALDKGTNKRCQCTLRRSKFPLYPEHCGAVAKYRIDGKYYCARHAK